ncbi:MAG: GTP-binding protein [Acetobacteraceae bacterium]|jgi:G3E family GTPase
MAEAFPTFTPVNLLTGFLGSGKTTLLRHLLGNPELAETAVLINEFGEAGLDHQLVERIDETVVLLRSGCLCCTIRGELARAIGDLHARRDRGEVPAFRRLVIESSGLADPFPVLTTLKADPVLRHHFRAGAVITTVDAVNGLSQIERHVESIRQLAVADQLVLTKTDLTDAASAAALLARVRQINPDAPVSRADDLDARTLLDHGAPATRFRSFHADDDVAGTSHASRIRSFVVTVPEPLDWTAFGIWLSMLLNRHGDKVLRVKGILNLAGEPAPVAIHGVQHLVHNPVHMTGWPDADRNSRIVFIVDGIDPALIRRSLAAFNAVGVPAVERV